MAKEGVTAKRVVVRGDPIWLESTTSLRAGRMRGRICSTPQKTEEHGLHRGDTIEVEVDDEGRVLFVCTSAVAME